MKIYKIISVLLVASLVFSATGCKKDDDDYVEIGDGESSSQDVEGTEEKTDSTTTYVYTGKTLHRENCYYARAMQEHKKKEWNKDITTLVDDGYKFCGLCCPDEKLQYTEEDEETSGVDPNEATYVLNIKQKKFHKLNCKYVQDMSPSNTEYTDLERDVIIESGYAPCQTCNN